MRERPILFSAPMVCAILDGRKTQTRRVVKRCGLWESTGTGKGMRPMPEACPIGKVGDLLWVKETGWERPYRSLRDMREGADTWEPYYYDADGLTDIDRHDFAAWRFKRRPSIHMPRWASRITLEITGVRVERLQDISDGDAKAEGVERVGNRWRHYFF